MPGPRLVHQSVPFPVAHGGTQRLQLLVGAGGEVRIERVHVLPHKQVVSALLQVGVGDQVRPLAIAATQVCHELERLLAMAYWLRLRTAGWRGARRCELVAAAGDGRPVLAWWVSPRKPVRRVSDLAERLTNLSRPVVGDGTLPAINQTGNLADLMAREHARLVREHEIESLIAADVLSPAEVFVAELEARGLLIEPDEPA